MNTKNRLFIVLAMLASFVASAQLAISEHTLDNGLQVYLVEDHDAPEIFGYVVNKAGAKEDPVDAEGIAHYLEHMLFKGTQKLGTTDWEKEKPIIEEIYSLYDELRSTDKKDKKKLDEIRDKINEASLRANEYTCQTEFDRLHKGIGGEWMNATTGQDRTDYFSKVPSHQLEAWLELYSERFINPVFRGFQAELEVVFEEKNRSLGNPFIDYAWRFQEELFPDHPYGRKIIGRTDHLKRPSLKKMKEYFDNYYVPNNMALVLCGDFDSAEALELVKKKFGRLKKNDKLPKDKVYKMRQFKGVEKVDVKLTPYKVGALVFNAVPNSHGDALTLQFIDYILSNASETGLLNKLVIDEQVGSASSYTSLFNDAGHFIIEYTPLLDLSQSTWDNIVQESFKSTSKTILKEVEKVKKGEFEDTRVSQARNFLLMSHKQSLESIGTKARIIGNYFQMGIPIKNLLDYEKKLKSITREKIVEVANRYLTNNYLAFNSTQGKVSHKKVKKPDYKPISPKAANKSAYAVAFEKLPSKMPKEQHVDFSKDFRKETIKNNVVLYYAKNTKNDVFNLTIKYGAGNQDIKNLKYASSLMNYSGTLKRKVKKLKEDFANISCSYSISSNDNYMNVDIEGDENYIVEALKIFTELLLAPKLEQKRLNLLVRSEFQSRNQESRRASGLHNALTQYVIYGNKSPYLDRLSVDELKSLNAGYLVGDYNKATGYEVELHYTGSLPFEKVKSIITQNLIFKSNLKPKTKYHTRPMNEVKKDQIYFIHNKDAVQSQILLYTKGINYTKDEDVQIDAFNQYFSGGFSGIVLQEIREQRSLAYGASASYSGRVIENATGYFAGSTSVQADKTVEAVKVFVDITKNMPLKPERIETLKKQLLQNSMSSKPSFRYLTSAVSSWTRLGYKDDPSKINKEKVKQLTFSDIESFYNTHIKGKSIAVVVVGNESDIDMKALKQIADVKKISKTKLFKN